MMNNRKVIKVGIAELDIVHTPNVIRTAGLGSCVGVVIYDRDKKIAGMAHVMLPDSSHARRVQFNVAKYADTAVDQLVELLKLNGARKFAFRAKLAGGAQMFEFTKQSDLMRIGPRNAEAVIIALKNHGIKIISRDLGGNSGRTIEFNPDDSRLYIRTVTKGETYI